MSEPAAPAADPAGPPAGDARAGGAPAGGGRPDEAHPGGARTAPAERTVLAWSRTAAAYGVVGLLLLRLAAGSVPLLLGVAAGVAAGTGAIGLVARSRWRLARAAAEAGRPLPAVGAAITLAGAVAALGLAAAVLVLFR